MSQSKFNRSTFRKRSSSHKSRSFPGMLFRGTNAYILICHQFKRIVNYIRLIHILQTEKSKTTSMPPKPIPENSLEPSKVSAARAPLARFPCAAKPGAWWAARRAAGCWRARGACSTPSRWSGTNKRSKRQSQMSFSQSPKPFA